MKITLSVTLLTVLLLLFVLRPNSHTIDLNPPREVNVILDVSHTTLTVTNGKIRKFQRNT